MADLAVRNEVEACEKIRSYSLSLIGADQKRLQWCREIMRFDFCFKAVEIL